MHSSVREKKLLSNQQSKNVTEKYNAFSINSFKRMLRPNLNQLKAVRKSHQRLGEAHRIDSTPAWLGTISDEIGFF